MRDLPQRMHPGIGPPRAMHAHAAARHRRHRVFQRALYRRAVVLKLLAAKWRAVIFDDELVTRHQIIASGGASGVPRRKSGAVIGCLPARWTCSRRLAPLLHAMVNCASSIAPG